MNILGLKAVKRSEDVEKLVVSVRNKIVEELMFGLNNTYLGEPLNKSTMKNITCDVSDILRKYMPAETKFKVDLEEGDDAGSVSVKINMEDPRTDTRYGYGFIIGDLNLVKH